MQLAAVETENNRQRERDEMENHNLDVVNHFVVQLYQAGVRHVCISPGSRSTPLTMALARFGKIQTWTLLDERSSAFFAVGLARTSGTAVALVCTSGTATANYLPAVMEAYQTRVPLVILTADRPPELRGIGSNQTVDQVKLYAGHVKWQVEMPVPDDSDDIIAHANMTAWRAVSAATTAPKGPVHINWPFREPLVPPYATFSHAEETVSRSWFPGIGVPTEDAMSHALKLISESERPLVVCGPLTDERIAEDVIRFASLLDAPLFADVLSNVRSCRTCDMDANIIDTYDTWLPKRDKLSLPNPDLIIRFGGTPTSKSLGQYLKEHSNIRQVLVDPSPSWRDASYSATDVFQCDELAFMECVKSRLSVLRHPNWQAFWREQNNRAASVLNAAFAEGKWHEAGVIMALQTVFSETEEQDVQVFCGNSMPVRDFESYFRKGTKGVSFLSNRGASGIDGVVSSAFGARAGNPIPTILVIGDVSFYHDLNGLLAAKRFGLPLLVIVVNNDGGGIFSFLPQSGYKDTFSYFQTSHGLDFEPLVTGYGGTFKRVSTWNEFVFSVKEGMNADGLYVIEVPTNSDENVTWHRNVQEEICQALEMVVWKES
jgi:2-succinyl-5-enolpyruvyl-6-hydroxy-3-cyclohexene-1-carboxylate synthase